LIPLQVCRRSCVALADRHSRIRTRADRHDAGTIPFDWQLTSDGFIISTSLASQLPLVKSKQIKMLSSLTFNPYRTAQSTENHHDIELGSATTVAVENVDTLEESPIMQLKEIVLQRLVHRPLTTLLPSSLSTK
jgi:hypothetical protein